MKTMRERLKVRLQRDRPMTTISLRMPEDVIDDLKEIARTSAKACAKISRASTAPR
jgi:hypothetical protein